MRPSGSRTVISWVPQCGACYFCAHGQPELCEPGSAAAMSGGMLDMTSRFSAGGQPLFQVEGQLEGVGRLPLPPGVHEQDAEPVPADGQFLDMLRDAGERLDLAPGGPRATP